MGKDSPHEVILSSAGSGLIPNVRLPLGSGLAQPSVLDLAPRRLPISFCQGHLDAQDLNIQVIGRVLRYRARRIVKDSQIRHVKYTLTVA